MYLYYLMSDVIRHLYKGIDIAPPKNSILWDVLICPDCQRKRSELNNKFSLSSDSKSLDENESKFVFQELWFFWITNDYFLLNFPYMVFSWCLGGVWGVSTLISCVMILMSSEQGLVLQPKTLSQRLHLQIQSHQSMNFRNTIGPRGMASNNDNV